MAITCRVFDARPDRFVATPEGYRERRMAVFVADAGELDRTDFTELEVEVKRSDVPAVARGRWVQAAMDEAARLGYPLTRNNVVFSDFTRGN